MLRAAGNRRRGSRTMAQAPKTLLEMAGAPNTPHPLSQSTVVMIDAQREYLDGHLPLVGIEDALAEGARLLFAARAAGAPVIHVVHKGRPGGLFDPESSNFEIAPMVAAIEGEQRVEKGLPNAFAGTDLKEKLDADGRKSLIVAGFMTHMCVSSTVRAALDLGFGCTVVGGACATRDLPDGAGGTLAAADLHRAELAALADRFAVVVPSAESLGG
jgi:nicotinamidase-related amidase